MHTVANTCEQILGERALDSTFLKARLKIEGVHADRKVTVACRLGDTGW